MNTTDVSGRCHHCLPRPDYPLIRAARSAPGMLLENLGDPVRNADDSEEAHAAVHVHRALRRHPE